MFFLPQKHERQTGLLLCMDHVRTALPWRPPWLRLPFRLGLGPPRGTDGIRPRSRAAHALFRTSAVLSRSWHFFFNWPIEVPFSIYTQLKKLPLLEQAWVMWMGDLRSDKFVWISEQLH